MSNVVSLEDPFTYIQDKGRIVAVMWKKEKNYLAISLSGYISRIGDHPKPHEMRQLMIMWLAIDCPHVLAEDDRWKEQAARESATDSD